MCPNTEFFLVRIFWSITLSWRRSLSYRDQSIDLICKAMDWFLYDNELCHERANDFSLVISIPALAQRVFISSEYYNLFFTGKWQHFLLQVFLQYYHGNVLVSYLQTKQKKKNWKSWKNVFKKTNPLNNEKITPLNNIVLSENLYLLCKKKISVGS